jgi:hypothetical protein
MTCLRACFVSVAVLAMAAASSPASAQTSQSTSQANGFFAGKLTVFVNFGIQAGSGDISQNLAPLIYDEQANINIAQTYENGPLIDVGGSYMLFEKFGGKIGAGVAYSHTSGDGNATIAAQIPDPLITDNFRAAALSATGLNHLENAVHVDVLYRYAVTPKIDVTVGLGPTFFALKQDFVTELTVAETVSPPGPFVNPTVTPVVTRVSKSPVGFNISADATYMINNMFGAGLLLRFTHANPSLDVPNTATPIDVRAGGFQVAGGVRVRF